MGKYILAVSGGVDSVAMLHWLVQHCAETRNQKPETSFVVAHFQHGIRQDDDFDARFVEALAKKYNLPFELGKGELGAGASEAKARKARWDYLNKIKDKYKAHGICTAHHKDDVLETAIINLLRGTGRKGLDSLKETPDIKRPLIELTKEELYEYAINNRLEWLEDPTNISDKYLRNRVRKYIVPKIKHTEKFIECVENVKKLNPEIDQELDELGGNLIGKIAAKNQYLSEIEIEKQDLRNTPEPVLAEVILWVAEQIYGPPNISSDQLKRILNFVNSSITGKLMQVNKYLHIKMGRDKVKFINPQK